MIVTTLVCPESVLARLLAIPAKTSLIHYILPHNRIRTTALQNIRMLGGDHETLHAVSDGVSMRSHHQTRLCTLHRLYPDGVGIA